MADPKKRFFDIWFVTANNVIKEVPYHVLADWVQTGKVKADDRMKPSGTPEWFVVGSVPAFQPYLPQPEALEEIVKTSSVTASSAEIEPVELEVEFPKHTEEEDDDVDMIPLIDISLVLLIFFMMTTTVAAISRIQVPSMENGATIGADPEIVRIDIDFRDGKAFYGIGKGTAAPTPEDDNLESDVAMIAKFDEYLKTLTTAPKVRIAAHGKLRYETVEEVMKLLERRRDKNQIVEYAVEVGEKVKS